ncbi:MAG: hypothetical protein ACR2NZ_07860 [Rubripirellula sp.]
MLLTDLSAHVGNDVALPGELCQEFEESTYHLCEGFLIHLQRELCFGSFLPDACELRVFFGRDSHSIRYSCVRNVASVWLSEIAIREFLEADDAKRESWFLEHLHEGVVLAAKAQCVSVVAIDRAYRRAQAEGCLLRVIDSGLSRRHPSRRLMFNVVRSLQREGESWSLEVDDCAGHTVAKFPLIDDTLYPRAHAVLRSSKWNGDTFVLADEDGKISFQRSSSRLPVRYARA